MPVGGPPAPSAGKEVSPLKRFSPRDLALYLLLLLLTLFAVNTLQQMNRANDPSYSQIRTLFEQEKVKNFSVKDNVLTMTVRGEGDQTSTVTYELSNFYVFYNDLHELIDQQRSEGIIEDYDYPMGVQGSWWYQYLPYLLVILVMAGLAYMLFLRQSAANGGAAAPAPTASATPAPAPWLTRARRSPSTMWRAPTRRRRSCRRSWSFSGTPSASPPWAPASPRACCWLALRAPVRL